MVAAAGANPESTLARLKRGYDQGLWSYDNTLDPSLLYSGARIRGEGDLGQGYQDNLASAAAAIQSQLGGINDSLNAALGADADKVSGAYADAYNRAVAAALANPPADSSGGGGGGGAPAGPAPGSPNMTSLAQAAAAGVLPWIYQALHGS
jgi:hypothetical protein